MQGGEPFHDEGDSTFTQDADGTIHVGSDNSRITLTRLGPGRGRNIEYKMSLFETHSICNTDLSGNAQIDTAASAHTNYQVANNVTAHVEEQGKPGFTGVQLGDWPTEFDD